MRHGFGFFRASSGAQDARFLLERVDDDFDDASKALARAETRLRIAALALPPNPKGNQLRQVLKTEADRLHEVWFQLQRQANTIRGFQDTMRGSMGGE